MTERNDKYGKGPRAHIMWVFLFQHDLFIIQSGIIKI